MSDIDGFISAPIKLAAIINNRRKAQEINELDQSSSNKVSVALRCHTDRDHCQLAKQQLPNKNTLFGSHLCSRPHCANLLSLPLLFLLILPTNANLIMNNQLQPQQQQRQADLLRHQTHYMNIIPSTHFQYNEGRQSQRQSDNGIVSLDPTATSNIQERSFGHAQQVASADRQVATNSQQQQQHSTSHIYKRSSALISSAGSHYPPLVSSLHGQHAMNPLRRRMMSEGAHSRWTAPQMINHQSNQNLNDPTQQSSSLSEEQQLTDLLASHFGNHQAASAADDSGSLSSLSSTGKPIVVSPGLSKAKRDHEEAELLKQKQHIQYHDQWPSMAGKCHKRTLNFCASVLPFNTTTFPNIIGDTNRFEVKRSLPFFGFLAKSSCNKRLDELLCLLLEPPCSIQSGLAIPPCKKFCRLALEGCNEYIPATLAMSSVFDCRQYPDSNDPSVCINLAQGSKCAADEFKCPDKTCIPRNWLCDGVRDCIFAADEANCTGVGLQTSVCSTEEFKCDGKCVPKAWKCDGERDCLDGSDEESCDQRPRCGADRFRCADGNGCLPKRWVCDGKAECRDGSDEMNCEQRQCSENDFKCDNGICIPKLWRCDRQFDCKDGSDERSCIYSASTTTTTTTTTTPVPSPTTTIATQPPPTTDTPNPYVNTSYSSASSSEMMSAVNSGSEAAQSINHQQQVAVNPSSENYYSGGEPSSSRQQSSSMSRQQLESNLNDDVSRIIMQESSSTSSSPSSSLSPDVVAVDMQQQASTIPVQLMDIVSSQKPALQQLQDAKELKKFDYDIIQSSSSPNLIQLNQFEQLTSSPSNGEIANANAQNGQLQQSQHQQQQHQQQQVVTQIDFVPQQQQPFASRQVTPAADHPTQQQVAFRGHHHQHIQHQQQQEQRGRSFPGGQMVVKGSPSSLNSADYSTPAATLERVPIYRSIFKTLKGGQARVPGALSSAHLRYPNVAGRKRRERHNQASHQQQVTASVMTTQSVDDFARLVQWTSVSPGADSSVLNSASSPSPSQSAQQQQNNHHHHQQQQANYTAPISSHPRSHGVASYLQLLNNRYHLRLPRVSPLPPVSA